MAIMMRHETPGITADQFDALFAPLLEQLTFFPGFIAHVSGPTDDGYQVTEVWESREAHERWLREVIMPTMQRAGLTQPLPPAQYLTISRFVTH